MNAILRSFGDQTDCKGEEGAVQGVMHQQMDVAQRMQKKRRDMPRRFLLNGWGITA